MQRKYECRGAGHVHGWCRQAHKGEGVQPCCVQQRWAAAWAWGHKQAARGGVPGEGHISPSHLRMLPADQLLVVLRGPLDDDLQLAQRLCRLGDAQAQVILLRGAEGGLRRQARRALLLLLDALNQLLQLAQPGGQEAGGGSMLVSGAQPGAGQGPAAALPATATTAPPLATLGSSPGPQLRAAARSCCPT